MPRCAVKRTHFSPSRSNGSISISCRLEVLAPVSIFARRPATPKSGSATHSRRPTTVKWSNVFNMGNRSVRPGVRWNLGQGFECRPGEPVTLHQKYSAVGQEVALAGTFDAFGNDSNAQLLTDCDNPLDDYLTDTILVDIANQRHVEFDQVRLEIGQQVQPRIAGTEIVDGGLEAEFAVFTQNIGQMAIVIYVLAFQRFKNQLVQRKVVRAGRLQRAANTQLGPVNRIGHEIDRKMGLHTQGSGPGNRLGTTPLVKAVTVA